MKRRVSRPLVVAVIALLAGCQQDGFQVGDLGGQGPGIEKKIGLIAPVPLKPAAAFSGQRHLGLEILSGGYDRVPYFVSSPARVTIQRKECQAIYLAGDRDGKTPMQVDNFLLVEVNQNGARKSVTLGSVDHARYAGTELPHIGPDSKSVPAGIPRLDKVIKPGVPADITVTALSNQDYGSASPVYLIIERPQAAKDTNCADGSSDFASDDNHKRPVPVASEETIFKTPEERARSFKTMPAEAIPSLNPAAATSANDVANDAQPLPGGLRPDQLPPGVTPQMIERMRGFTSTPTPDQAPAQTSAAPIPVSVPSTLQAVSQKQSAPTPGAVAKASLPVTSESIPVSRSVSRQLPAQSAPAADMGQPANTNTLDRQWHNKQARTAPPMMAQPETSVHGAAQPVPNFRASLPQQGIDKNVLRLPQKGVNVTSQSINTIRSGPKLAAEPAMITQPAQPNQITSRTMQPPVPPPMPVQNQQPVQVMNAPQMINQSGINPDTSKAVAAMPATTLQNGQPALGSVIRAGKIVVRKDAKGNVTQHFEPGGGQSDIQPKTAGDAQPAQ